MGPGKIMALLLLIVFIEGAYLYSTSRDVVPEYEVCTREKSQYCVYEGVDVLSDLNALLWVRDNVPVGTIFISWWDYGKELDAIGNADVLIKNPSRPLLNTSSYFIAANISGDDAVVDPQSVVKAVAVFMATSEAKTALCLARKYGAEYVYMTASDFFKYHSIYFTAREEELMPESELETISGLYEKKNINEFEKLQMEDRILIEASKESTYMRLYISGDYNTMYFDPVYSDNLSGAPFFSRVKIYSINTYAMPENCCNNISCNIEGRRIALKAPSQMSLRQEDLGPGYSASNVETYAPGNISEDELGYGWRAGQWVVFETFEGERRVANRVDVYGRDSVKERFDALKEELANTSGVEFVSAPAIGDEAFAYNLTYSGAKVLYKAYFRMYDVIAAVSVLGAEGMFSADDAVRYAKLIEGRIG